MPSSADVNIVIQDVEHEREFIDVQIFLDAENWLKEDQPTEHIILQATKDEVVVSLMTFQDGTLAAMVYNDENGDGEMNIEFFGGLKKASRSATNTLPKAPRNFLKPLSTSRTVKVS